MIFILSLDFLKSCQRFLGWRQQEFRGHSKTTWTNRGLLWTLGALPTLCPRGLTPYLLAISICEFDNIYSSTTFFFNDFFLFWTRLFSCASYITSSCPRSFWTTPESIHHTIKIQLPETVLIIRIRNIVMNKGKSSRDLVQKICSRVYCLSNFSKV